MICEGCRAGADNMTDYRDAAARDDKDRVDRGQEPMKPENARRWIVKRARLSLSLHCISSEAAMRDNARCSCQCKIPELQP